MWHGGTRPHRRTVADVMTRDVVTAAPSAPFKELEALMAQHDISAIPIVERGRLVGIVSEADLLYKAEQPGPARVFAPARDRRWHAKAAGVTARDVMTWPVIGIEPTAPLNAAARLMRVHHVKRLAVVSGDTLHGILSRADVLRPYLREDAEIREEIVEGIVRGVLWLDPATLDVDVREGVVQLSGRLDRRSDADVLEHLTSGVDGVVDVVNTVQSAYDDRAATPAHEAFVR